MPWRGAHDQLPSLRKSGMMAACAWLGMMLIGCTVEQVTVVEVSTVEVLPPQVVTVTGERTQMSAVVRNGRGEAVKDAEVLWGSTEPSIAQVNATGLLVALRPGWVDVHATYGGVSGSAPVFVASQ